MSSSGPGFHHSSTGVVLELASADEGGFHLAKRDEGMTEFTGDPSRSLAKPTVEEKGGAHPGAHEDAEQVVHAHTGSDLGLGKGADVDVVVDHHAAARAARRESGLDIDVVIPAGQVVGDGQHAASGSHGPWHAHTDRLGPIVGIDLCDGLRDRVEYVVWRADPGRRLLRLLDHDAVVDEHRHDLRSAEIDADGGHMSPTRSITRRPRPPGSRGPTRRRCALARRRGSPVPGYAGTADREAEGEEVER